MSALGPLVAWALEALIATTLLLALVMALRGPVRRLFGPQVAYALWLLPALRMILPPLPQDWRAATPITRASETITLIVVPGHVPSGAAVAAQASGPSAAIVALVGWAAIALAFLAFQMWRHRRFCRAVLAGGRTIDHAGRIAIVESAAAPGPIAFGVLQRYVAFPRDFAERYDEDERALALAHELGHHQRGDLAANWFALFILALHWFNPLAWIAHKAFRADQELANDARVLAGRSLYDRHAYACAIVKAAHGGPLSAACHLHSIKDLKGRLKMLRTQTSRRRIAAGGLGIAAVTLGALGVTASGTRAAESVRASVSKTTGVPLPVTATTVERVDGGASQGHGHTRVVILRNGKTTTLEGEAAEAYLAAAPTPPVPPVAPAPAAPPQPDVPAVAPVPPTPPTPPAPAAHHAAMAQADAQASMRVAMGQASIAIRSVPVVVSGRCGDGGDHAPNTIRTVIDGRRQITICTDRIERRAHRGDEMVADAARVRRIAMTQALAGMRAARAAMARNMHHGSEAREEALEAMQDSIADLEQDLREVD